MFAIINVRWTPKRGLFGRNLMLSPLFINLRPSLEESIKYKLGIWVQDDPSIFLLLFWHALNIYVKWKNISFQTNIFSEKRRTMHRLLVANLIWILGVSQLKEGRLIIILMKLYLVARNQLYPCSILTHTDYNCHVISLILSIHCNLCALYVTNKLV